MSSSHRLLVGLVVTLAITGVQTPESVAQEASTRVLLRDGMSAVYSGSYGGELPANSVAPGCSGFVSNVPDFVIEIETDGWSRIAVDTLGDEDTTLLVRGQSGYLCNDDAEAASVDPEITSYLTAGEYNIYVGGPSARDRGDYDIHFQHGGQAVIPEITGDRPVQLFGVSGGPVDASDILAGCVGAVGELPHHQIRLARTTYLEITTASASDLTLVVSSGGEVRCNDDAENTLAPEISGWFNEGLVRIYVGSHNPRVDASYTLSVTPTQVQ